MANQPRPWFRMPNLARQPTASAPTPTPAPTPASTPAPQTQVQPQAPAPQQVRIPAIRPAFRPAFTQAQPAPPPPPPPQPPQPQYAPSPPPAQPPSPITTNTNVIASGTTRVIASPSPSPPAPTPAPAPTPYVSSVNSPRTSSPSPKTTQFRTPIESPKVVELESPIKTTRSPPPITLPPQLNSSKGEPEPRTLPEVEQEKVLLHETFNRKVVHPDAHEGNSLKGFGHKAINHSNKHGRHKEANAPRKATSDSEDGKNVRIINMKGENKGALMELGFPSRRNGGKTIGNFPGSSHILGNESKESETLNGGNEDRSKIKDHKGTETPSRPPMNGYVNSNVQSINNSIMYNCSFTHHDPGVHFSLSRKPIKGKGEGHGHGHGNHHKHHGNGKQV